jgi:hypothetical protein
MIYSVTIVDIIDRLWNFADKGRVIMVRVPKINIRELYDRFDAPVTVFDCGQKCAPHNPSGKPFCCDICQAVPAAYYQEWEYLQPRTDLWHEWRGDECSSKQEPSSDPIHPDDLLADTPEHMLLLACKGPAHCQREYRAMSCRQFPFFPYITSQGDFIGLAYEWEFEPVCWVISNLGAVTDTYRDEFVRVYDALFAGWLEEFESYHIKSEQMREHFTTLKRRIPLLHRRGGCYLLSPGSERMRQASVERLPRFGPYIRPETE